MQAFEQARNGVGTTTTFSRIANHPMQPAAFVDMRIHQASPLWQLLHPVQLSELIRSLLSLLW